MKVHSSRTFERLRRIRVDGIVTWTHLGFFFPWPPATPKLCRAQVKEPWELFLDQKKMLHVLLLVYHSLQQIVPLNL